MEDFAQKWQNFEAVCSEELADWEIPVMRQRFAWTYRRLVGVHPALRQELRIQLQSVAEYGLGTVDRAVAETNQLLHANSTPDSSSCEDPFA